VSLLGVDTKRNLRDNEKGSGDEREQSRDRGTTGVAREQQSGSGCGVSEATEGTTTEATEVRGMASRR